MSKENNKAVQTSENTAPEKQKKHVLSYEKRKGLYGYGFIGLWALGTIYFFIAPLVMSLIYSFNETKVEVGGMEMKWIGMKNYVNAFRKDQDYTLALVDMLLERHQYLLRIDRFDQIVRYLLPYGLIHDVLFFRLRDHHHG